MGKCGKEGPCCGGSCGTKKMDVAAASEAVQELIRKLKAGEVEIYVDKDSVLQARGPEVQDDQPWNTALT